MRLQALIGATLLTLAASATFAWRPAPKAALPQAPAASGVPSSKQIAAFQAQAEKGCRCARIRTESEKKDCWADFEREIVPWPHGQEISMCEFSLDGICFGEGFDSDQACVIKGWSGPVGGPRSICTQEELQTAEAVWLEALRQHHKDKTKEPPEQALKRTLATFARSDRVAHRQSSGGCGGG